MIILDMEQGTEEWLQARMGIPTASAFDRIFTASFKPSAQSNAYTHEQRALHRSALKTLIQ